MFANSDEVSLEFKENLLNVIMDNAIQHNRFDLALFMWKHYSLYLIKNPKKIVETIVSQLEESLSAIEFKSFLFVEMLHYMKPVHFTRILAALTKKVVKEECDLL